MHRSRMYSSLEFKDNYVFPDMDTWMQMHASMMGGNKVYKSNVDSIKKRLKQNERGLNFIAEFYADLDYDENGKLVLTKGKNSLYDSDLAAERTLRAIKEKKVKTTSGTDIDVGCDIICVHSDTPNAVEIITKLKSAIKNK